MINSPPSSTPLNVQTLDRRPPQQFADLVKSLRAFFDKGWVSWFSQVFQICFAVTQSGTTANRPVALSTLWAGRTYFDTTLGIPIWWDAAAGVWVDATGTPV